MISIRFSVCWVIDFLPLDDSSENRGTNGITTISLIHTSVASKSIVNGIIESSHTIRHWSRPIDTLPLLENNPSFDVIK